MEPKLVSLKTKLKALRARFKENEEIWYELRDAQSPPEAPPEEARNGRRDKATYDHVKETLLIQLEFLKLEIELIKLGDSSEVTLNNLKQDREVT